MEFFARLRAKDETRGAVKSAERQFTSLGTKIRSIKALPLLGVLATLRVMVSVARKIGESFSWIVAVNRETQSLQASLATVTGSTAAAESAFEKLNRFARETPFQGFPRTCGDRPGAGGKISIRVRYLTMTERRSLQERLVSDRALTDADLIRDLLVGWSGVADEKGEEIPFSGGAVEELIDIPYFHDAVRNAIIDHLLGGREKKLYHAARQWVAGDPAIEVWADDAPVVEAWLRIATCWRSAGWGGLPWLAWADARAVLEMSGILPEDETARRDLMDGLTAMEAGALAELSSSAGRTD